MTDTKTQLKDMINENVSSIQIMSDKLEIEMEEVIALLNELLADGSIEGTITKDGLRFFRDKVKLSDRPSVTIEDEGPKFLKYNTRPGKIITIIGFSIVICGLVLSYVASSTHSFEMLNLTALVLAIGLGCMMIGGYQVARRPTPI